MCTSGDMSTSGLAAAILDLSLPVRSDSFVGITVGLLDPENIGLAVGIAVAEYSVSVSGSVGRS